MKISFEGANLGDVVSEMLKFAEAFSSTTPCSAVKTGTVVEVEKPKKGRPPFKKPEEKSITMGSGTMGMSFVVPSNTLTNAEKLATETPHNIKYTKEDLTQALQKVCEKVDAGDPKKTAGISKVRDIFAHFGIKRLGELDEKRYHELMNYIQEILK